MRHSSILAIDDDEVIRDVLRELLERAGYDVRLAADGRAGLRAFHARPPDLVILDVMMPVLDGWQTLERIRDLSDVPVIMLTSRGGELERVRGLSGGSDDYIIKPFGRQELLARVEAILRRTRNVVHTDEVYDDTVIEVGFAEWSVKLRGEAISLTPLEFRLLSAFVRHPDQVLSPDQLIGFVWNDPGRASSDQVKLYVSYLRRKIGSELIETVRGFGYRYRRQG